MSKKKEKKWLPRGEFRPRWHKIHEPKSNYKRKDKKTILDNHYDEIGIEEKKKTEEETIVYPEENK